VYPLERAEECAELIRCSRETQQSLPRNGDDFNTREYANAVLVVKPLAQSVDLIHRERGIDVIDADIRR
jgi:hypothetical protein